MWALLLIVAGVGLFWCFLRQYWKKFPDFRQKYVLITGCDCGLGRQLATELIGQKIPVIACCLTEDGVRSIRDDAAVSAAVKNSAIWTPIFDVTKDDDASRIEQVVRNIVGENGNAIISVCSK